MSIFTNLTHTHTSQSSLLTSGRLLTKEPRPALAVGTTTAQAHLTFPCKGSPAITQFTGMVFLSDGFFLGHTRCWPILTELPNLMKFSRHSWLHTVPYLALKLQCTTQTSSSVSLDSDNMLLMRPIHIAPIEHHQTLRVARTVPNPSSRHRHLFSSSLPHRRKKIRSFLFDHHALQSLNITLCKIPSQLRVNLSNHETSLNIHPSIAMTSSSLPSKAVLRF